MNTASEKNKVLRPFKPAGHKHQKCLDSAVQAAKKHCKASGLRLTPLRQRVLELVWQSHEPVKAYDILAQLKNDHGASAPPTVYRALDFLQAEGLVHKIESLNAYVGCGNPVESHSGQFLICHQCGTVAELDDPDIRFLLKEKAGDLGFEIQDEMVEINGLCKDCINIEKG